MSSAERRRSIKRRLALGALVAGALAISAVAGAQQMMSLGQGQSRTWSGEARGDAQLPGCRLGYYAQPGGLILNYAGGDSQLAFRTESGGDPVMCLTTPTGSYFNDDTNGLNPQIIIPNPPPGMYTLRIGTYSQGGRVSTSTYIGP